MTNVASEVRVAGDGGLYRAPLATAEPASAAVALAAAYVNLGYFTTDGVTMAFEDNVNNIFAWQNSVVVRAARTETLTTLTFTPMQTRGSVLETFHPGSQIASHATSEFRLPIAPAVASPYSWVFDAVDGTNHMRYYIPNGEITERGEVMHVNGEPVGYPMTMTFYPDSAGFVAYLLTDIAAVGTDI